MEFDFLPKLPTSNLDDRTFDDLVEECVLRIPRYCQEWTCFYLVLNSSDSLDGNVLAVTFQGGAATPTGINPARPPRSWEAWDG